MSDFRRSFVRGLGWKIAGVVIAAAAALGGALLTGVLRS